MKELNYNDGFISIIEGDYERDPYYWIAATGVHESYEAARRRRVYYLDTVFVSRDEYRLEMVGEHDLRKRRTEDISRAGIYLVQAK